MRLFLAADQTRPADRAREQLMDANPWTYPVTAKELLREAKIESPSSPATPAVGDQRTYLYIEVDKDTADLRQVGLTVGVRLRGDPTLYRCDHGEPSWSVERDVPAATTVELPAGTTPADIAEILAIRQPMSDPDSGAAETVTRSTARSSSTLTTCRSRRSSPGTAPHPNPRPTPGHPVVVPIALPAARRRQPPRPGMFGAGACRASPSPV